MKQPFMTDEFIEDYETRFNLAKEKIRKGKEKGRVNISRLGLKSFPKELFEITNLQELFAGGNQLVDLPEEFSQLQELKVLNIQRCQFTFIPKVIFELKNLKSLDLSNNKIEVIPAEIEKLTNLNSLLLSKNRIEKLPKEIGNLSNISSIDLRRNKINSIPNEMANLTNLTRIVLTGNPINFPHNKSLPGLLPNQNSILQILHYFVKNGVYRNIDENVKSEVNIPETLRTAFHQYLIFFNDFVKKTKDTEINLSIKQIDEGLEITYSSNLNKIKIQKFLDEYIGFIQQNVENIQPKFETEISKSEKEIFIVDLKSQVRHLTTQIEIKDVENRLLRENVDKLYGLLTIRSQNPQPIFIKAQSSASADAFSSSEATIDFKMEVNNIQKNFLTLKEEISSVLSDYQIKELEKIDNELLEIDELSQDPKSVDNSSFKRLKRIIEQINDPDSNWNKAVSATKKGIKLAQNLGRNYNKIAPWLVIPTIPEQLLGK